MKILARNLFTNIISLFLLLQSTCTNLIYCWDEIHRDAATLIFGRWKSIEDQKFALETVVMPNCEIAHDEEQGHDVPPEKWPSKGKGKWV